MNPLLNIALKAARKAAQYIARAQDQLTHDQIEQKGSNDYVTSVDKNAEKIIIDVITQTYPSHSILAEESGQTPQESDYQWVIDPLDGTTNFIFGIPHFAVSIGLLYKGVPEHAIVVDVIKQEEFTASRGGGAFLNGRRMRVKSRTSLSGSLIGTGVPFNQHNEQKIEAYLKILKNFMLQNTSGVRRMGAASLDLAYVAAGRLDGFWEFGLKPWDIAAGCLLVLEAGGLVGDFKGGHDYITSGNIIAGSPKVFKSVAQIVNHNA